MKIAEEFSESSMIGKRVGSYRLDEEVGRGGMGVVYRASRVDGEFDQTVALKLIKRGMDTDLILRRFRRERQITATLNHPNIAFFYGGGSTDEGLPYFVMEFIHGKPLYKYCNANRLSIRDRLTIFRQICWAVAAAHEIQVVHRDLKPSNIMVNDAGKPKLLDFGIAKMLDPEMSGTDDIPTATQMRAMTPEYASPEQISGEELDTASDIYSLGVILYELLTGHRPYALRRAASDDAARIIREEMPTNPSGSVTSGDNLVPDNGGEMTLERIFTGRGTTAEELRRELTGDIDKIVLKTLRKRPEERYRTAVNLADDITNYLEGRPVDAEYFVSMTNLSRQAAPGTFTAAIIPFKVLSAPTTGDTGDDFVGVGMADALISRLSGVPRLIVRPTTSVLPFANSNPYQAAKALGVDYVLDGNVRIVHGRIRVSVQLYCAGRDTTEWAKAFDTDVRNVLDLEDSIADQVARSLLSQLTAEESERLGRRGTDKPEAYEAYLRGRYFWSRFNDKDLLKAVAEFEKAIEIDPNYAYPYIGLADYYMWAAIFGEIPSMEAFPKAQAAARKALEINDTLGEAYAVLAWSVFLYDWNWKDAEYLLNRALELNPNSSAAHEYHSNFLIAQGRFDEGVAEILKAEELDPISPRAILMSAWTLYQPRRYDEALKKARKAFAMQENLPQGMLHLGNILTATGDLDEAVSLLRRSAEGWGKSGLPRYMLAHARAAQGDQEAVRKILDKMLATAEEDYMKPYFVGMTYVAAGDTDNAFEWFRRAVEERNEWMVWFATDPKLDTIRNDARYLEILKATNNPIVADRVATGESPNTGERERSIAVLPFRALATGDTGSRDDEYLSLGLADAVTMRLSNVRRFIVRPTSSVLPFAAGTTDAFQAGRELGVDFVVDGIIRRIGDKVRVTAQLLEVNEGATRWSASFSESFADVLELEDSISEQVTRSLLPKLSGEEEQLISKRGTNNSEAHDAYLQGRYFWNQFMPETYPKAIEAFRRAIEKDPNYALAHAGIADYYTWACIFGLVPAAETYPEVLRHATRALEIDSNLAEAHAALGLYYSNNYDYEKSEKHHRTAIELNPSYPLAHEWLSSMLVATGRFVEGMREILIAESLDPLSLRPKALSAWTAYQSRNFELAIEKSNELLSLAPDFMQSHLHLANALTVTSPGEKAVQAARRAVELSPGSPLPIYVLCFALAGAGEREQAVRTVDELEATGRTAYVPPYFLAMANLAIGRNGAALDHLFKVITEKSPWSIWIMTEPKIDALRNDPRFQSIAERTGLPQLFPSR